MLNKKAKLNVSKNSSLLLKKKSPKETNKKLPNWSTFFS